MGSTEEIASVLTDRVLMQKRENLNKNLCKCFRRYREREKAMQTK
jgi:hypothetical protein